MPGGCSAPGGQFLTGRFSRIERIVQSIQHQPNPPAKFQSSCTLLSFQEPVPEGDLEFCVKFSLRAHRDGNVVLVREPSLLPTPTLGDVRWNRNGGSLNLTFSSQIQFGASSSGRRSQRRPDPSPVATPPNRETKGFYPCRPPSTLRAAGRHLKSRGF